MFISTSERGKETVTSAKSGHTEVIGLDQFLILNNGQRMEATVGKGEIKVSEFNEYSTRVGAAKLGTPDERPIRAKSTRELLAEPTRPHQGELAWRIGMALAGLNFVVIALVLSSVNPRVGRTGGLIFALFTFVVYFNLINLGQSWVSNGKASLGGFTIGLHGGALLLGLLWLAKRHHQWSPRRPWQRAKAPAVAEAAR